MKAFSQLADLEALLLGISDENIRAYAGEAVSSYSVGAYRSAIVSIWIAVVYDLYQKFRYLDEEFGDPAAKQAISEIETIRSNPDKKQVSAWERTILDHAFNRVKMLTSTEYDHLNRIQQDRHRCAHPVLDDDGFLFQPSPELVRSHIRTAIETLLKQPAIIGKAAIDALTRDVEGQYFPTDYEAVRNSLLNRHILPTSDNYKSNLIKFSLKKVLHLEPDEAEIFVKYALVLKCLVNEFRSGFQTLDKAAITKSLEKTKDERIQFLSLIYNIDDSFLLNTPEHVKEKFKKFLSNDATVNHKAYIVHLFPEVKKDLTKRYPTEMPASVRKSFIKSLIRADISSKDPEFTDSIVRTNIDIFSSSKSYSTGKDNAENYLEPIIPLLSKQHIDYLINQTLDKQRDWDQLIDCAPIMETVFVETIDKFPQMLSMWVKFIDEKRNVWGNMKNLENLVNDAQVRYQSIAL